MAEDQNTVTRQASGLDRLRSREIIDTDHAQLSARHRFNEIINALMVFKVLVPVSDHGTSSVPLSLPNDVHGFGKKRIRVMHDSPDVEIVLPVFYGYVKRVTPFI